MPPSGLPNAAMPPARPSAGFSGSSAPARPVRDGRMGAVLTEAPPQARDDERSGPWATGPGLAGLGRPDVRVPAPRHDSGPINGSSYGDWTRPSRSNGTDESRAADLDAARGALLLRPAPGTSMIPEREIHRGRNAGFDDFDDADDYADDEYADDDELAETQYGGRPYDDYDDEEDLADTQYGGRPYDDDYDERFDSAEMPATGMQPVGGPGTGPVGGRAAKRAEREAAEAARLKAAKSRRGMAPAGDDSEQPRRPRRVAISLLAMALVALAVLGVYSFATPDTQTTGSTTATTPSAPAAPSTGSGASAIAQPSTVQPPAQAAAPTAPVRVPVTVLNATPINGLAAKIAAQVVAGGWQSPGVGAYKGDPVAATTVFFTEGDEQQRQAAVQLVDQFPGKLNGPAPRFFDVPGQATPGLVVVATGDWKP
jgi:hypothetical protein